MTENKPNSLTAIRNTIIASVAIILGILLVLSSQTTINSESLEAQSQQAIPLEVAVNNGKPSLVEFYANWCTSCQAMAGDLATLKQKYQENVNFVMLNVDNSKWLPEVLNYSVDGIPHFVFLNNEGEAMAQTIGEQPLSVLESNIEALMSNKSLPYANSSGNISSLKPNNQIIEGNKDNPRDHG